MTVINPATGVLITNLGTPDAPTPAALRRYLAEFLWDKRVVDLPRPLWWLILHGIILRTRPKRSAALYGKVWGEQGSPLLATARRQRERLAAELKERGHQVPVVLGMRYGKPSIAAAIDELHAAGVRRVVVLPLYPQNSCSTTASTFDAVSAALAARRALPALEFIADYHLHPGYIGALAASIREAWSQQAPAERIIFSFHGTPQRFADEGDLYYDQCRATAAALADTLELPAERWLMTFQSRFGREPWLQPYTDRTLAALPGQGVKSVDIVCPGFSADCLETLEEIALGNREHFLAAGGERYRYIPALNERPDHIAALADLVGARF